MYRYGVGSHVGGLHAQSVRQLQWRENDRWTEPVFFAGSIALGAHTVLHAAHLALSCPSTSHRLMRGHA